MTILFALIAWTSSAAGQDRAGERMLFDFEEPDAAAAWTLTTLPELKEPSPPVAVEVSNENATSGRQSLKLTFEGGAWPAVVTKRIPVPGTWKEYQSIRADVTVTSPCLIGFSVAQERSFADKGKWWNRTCFLARGRNEIVTILHDNSYSIPPEMGNVVSFAICMYKPGKGDVLYVDNVRVSTEWPEPKHTALNSFSPMCMNGFSVHVYRDFLARRRVSEFAIAGTDKVVKDVFDLGKQLESRWKAPERATGEAVRSSFESLYADVKKERPKAVLAVFRDGEAGYEGWRDTWLNSHGPDGPVKDRMTSHGKKEVIEVFMRHRSLAAKVDLSAIPTGSRILAARLVLTRVEDKAADKPNVFVVEPCNRPWDEEGAHCYEYAPGKLWKSVSGTFYGGDDPDFWPLYLAHGPAGLGVSVWDFTEAVGYWTDGKRPNHGFFIYGDSREYLRVYTREAKEGKNRPVVFVIYEPAG